MRPRRADLQAGRRREDGADAERPLPRPDPARPARRPLRRRRNADRRRRARVGLDRGLPEAREGRREVGRSLTTAREPRPALVLAGLVAGTALRLLLAGGLDGNYDQASWEIVARIVASGGNVYAETTRYNYGPAWSLILLALWKLHAVTGLSFHLCVRGFLSLADVGNALLVGDIARRAFSTPRGWATLAYALNPVAILVVGFHGQFDNLAALPLLAALRLALAPPSLPLGAIWALGTAALCVKHLNVFIVLALFLVVGSTLRRTAGLLAAALAVFGASFLPHLSTGMDGIVKNVLLYRGLAHPYGLATFLPRNVLFVVFAVVLSATPFLARRFLRLGPVETLELTTVALLVFIPGIGEPYFLLPVLFGAARRSLGWIVFTIVATFFLPFGPFGILGSRGPQLWNADWLALVFWLVFDVARALRARRAAPGAAAAAEA